MFQESSMDCDNNNPSSSSSSSSVPPSLLSEEDCLIQILLWLPVISLLRFKSVCKSWRAIIQNPFFIHTHHATTTTNNNLVVGSSTPVFIPYRLCSANIFTVVSGDDDDEFQDLGPTPYACYTQAHPQDVTMVGCCNGIICLHAINTMVDHSGNGRINSLYLNIDFHKYYIYHTISLWNPAIKQSTFLPIPFARLDEPNLALQGNYIGRFFGFGVDLKTNDHKLLLITYEKTKKNKDYYINKECLYARAVHVYSLSSDSWRSIDASDAQPNLIRHRHNWNQGHYLNGSYLFIAGYWYEPEFQEAATNSGQKCFKDVIMSFDFTEEIFRTIQLPFNVKTDMDSYASIILFGEKIAVTNVSCAPSADRPSCDCFDIWVLNGNDSWSKFYTFVSNAQPKFITDNGEFILLDGKDVAKLEWLNVVTGEIKDLQCDCEGPSRNIGVNITRVGVYKPSLVPIAGNGATDNCLQV